MTKKTLAILMVCALMLSVFVGCGGSDPTAEESAGNGGAADATDNASQGGDSNGNAGADLDGEIVFGVIASITGSFPLAGEMTMRGVNMACDEINAAGGVLGMKLVPQFEDDAGVQATAVNAAKKLIGDQVTAVVGPNISTNIIAISDDIQTSQIPFLVGGTSPLIYDLNNEYIFRIRPSDTISAAAAAQYMYETVGARNIGVFTNNDDFGTGAKNVILEYLATKDDVTIVEQGLNSGDKDLTGQIVMFKNADIDGLIYWGHDAEVSILARQTTELGLEVPTVTSGSLPQVIDTLDAEYVTGWCVATDMSAADTRPSMASFVQKFNSLYDLDPEVYATAYYGATILLADAIERAGSTDSEAIVAALLETSGVQGPIGEFACQDNRDMLSSCTIMQYDENKDQSVIAVVEVS